MSDKPIDIERVKRLASEGNEVARYIRDALIGEGDAEERHAHIPEFLLNRPAFDAFERELVALAKRYGWAIRESKVTEDKGINGNWPEWELELFQEPQPRRKDGEG